MFKRLFMWSSLLILFATNLAFASDVQASGSNGGLLQMFLAIVSYPLQIIQFLILASPFPGTDFRLVLPGFEMPLIVIWLVAAGVYFSVKMKFINITHFKEPFRVLFNNKSNDNPRAEGKVSNRQAMSAALSGTVGLGNIAGVAVAVSIGGPGAILWMVLSGVLAMNLKFVEITLGHMYRKKVNGKIIGGPYQYLMDGCSKYISNSAAKFLAKLFAFACLLGAFGSVIVFQSNQSVAILAQSFSANGSDIVQVMGMDINLKVLIGIILSIVVAVILYGGIVRIAKTTEIVVSFMGLFYIVMCLFVILANYSQILPALKIITTNAFTATAVGGGFVGAIIQGIRRSVFSHESGLGLASIAHSQVRSNNSIEVGFVGMLEPFIDTVVVCFLSGLALIVTGVYTLNDPAITGVLLTEKAFSTVLSPMIMSIFPYIVFLFAFSTILGYAYYCTKSLEDLLGKVSKTNDNLITLVISAVIIISGVATLGNIIDLIDVLILFIAIPNIIGLYILRNEFFEKLRASKLKK